MQQRHSEGRQRGSAASGRPQRILITGASGNVGTGVLRAITDAMPDAELVGVCRRPPRHAPWPVEWHAIDLSTPAAEESLDTAMRGVDVVVHLALAVQPTRDSYYLYRANVLGSQAVFNAMRRAGVGYLIYASSLSVYAPSGGPAVDERWPTTGQPSSTYSRHKVEVEQRLDRMAVDWPELRQARIRPTVVVQREAAPLFRRLYLGQFVPRVAVKVLRSGVFPVMPLPAGLRLQFVHADDVGNLVVRLLRTRAEGPINVAADPLPLPAVAGLVHARPVRVNAQVTRRVVLTLSRLGLVAVTPGWYEVATNSPLMDVSRARDELGWTPRWSSTISALELIDGLADGAVGLTAATGLDEEDHMRQQNVRRIHDVTLMLWAALAIVRAGGRSRPGQLDAAVVATHLIAGTPLAVERVRARRRDPVALLAPVAVGSALLASMRGGWAYAGCVAALVALAAADRRSSAGEAR